MLCVHRRYSFWLKTWTYHFFLVKYWCSSVFLHLFIQQNVNLGPHAAYLEVVNGKILWSRWPVRYGKMNIDSLPSITRIDEAWWDGELPKNRTVFNWELNYYLYWTNYFFFKKGQLRSKTARQGCQHELFDMSAVIFQRGVS